MQVSSSGNTVHKMFIYYVFKEGEWGRGAKSVTKVM